MWEQREGTVVLEKLTQGRGVKNPDEECMEKLYGNILSCSQI